MGADRSLHQPNDEDTPFREPLDLTALQKVETETLTAWRAACTTAGFDDDCIARFERVAPRQLDRVRLPAVHAALQQTEGRAARLARLFAYRDSLTDAELRDALPANVIEALTSAGVLVRTRARVRFGLRLMPFDGLWILSDEMDAPGDPVMGPGATTSELARLMRSEPGDDVLDVGCGAGTLALLAARQGANTTGVDLHPRAVDFSELNARFNGLEANFAQGDLLEPVRGQRFDLVISQPPFVVTPPDVDRTTYLHGGQRGDELALRLLAALPGALSRRGRALVLFDTPLDGAQLRESLQEVLAGEEPCGHLSLVSPGHDADTAAIGYAAVQCPRLDSNYRVAVERYRRHLRSLSIERLKHAALVVWPASRDRPQLAGSLQVPALVGWNAEKLEQLLEAAALAASPDEALLRSRISVPPDCRIVEERPLENPEAARTIARFAGHRFADRELSEAALVLIDSVRHGGRLDDAVQGFAAAASATPADVLPRVLQFVRESLLSGLLVPGAPEG